MFIVVEGLDGAGTTTQCQLLVDHLRRRGHVASYTSEPTTGPVGQVIRSTLREEPGAPDMRTLPWLFAADRADHLYRTIEPALERGEWVVSDRYLHSSLAYQSLTLPLEQVAGLNALFRLPDLTVFVELPVEACLDRIRARLSQGEARPEIYDRRHRLEQVDRNYRAVLDLQRSRGERVAVVDGTGDVDRVFARVLAAVDAVDRHSPAG